MIHVQILTGPQRWKKVKLPKSDGSFDKMIDRETPDHIALTATLQGSGAPLNFFLRGGKTFKGTPAVSWHIYGTKGEIRVTSQAPISLGLGNEKIELHDHEKDAVEVVDYEYLGPLKDLPPFAKNIGGLYELFVNNEGIEKGFVGFEEAVGMHKVLAAMEKSDAEKMVVKINL
jgi:predicted dehydrogenase